MENKYQIKDLQNKNFDSDEEEQKNLAQKDNLTVGLDENVGVQSLNPQNFIQNSKELTPDFDKFKKYFLADCSDPSSGWKKFMIDKNQQSIYLKKEEFSPVVIIRHETIFKKFEYNIHEFMKLNTDPEIRKIWDVVMTEYEIKEKIDDHSDIFYQRIHAGPLVSDRDFILYRYIINNQDHKKIIKQYGLEQLDSDEITYFAVFRSVERGDIPARKKIIRGHSYFGGFLIKQDKENPNQIIQIMVQHLDIKGRIPTALFNFIAPRQFKKLTSTFETAYPKIIKKLKEQQNK